MTKIQFPADPTETHGSDPSDTQDVHGDGQLPLPEVPSAPIPPGDESDAVAIQALRRAEHGLNNMLTSITVGPHDPRALAVARTKVQEAFMWAEKSIRQPRG